MELRIPNFSALKILVIGDVMLDRYWSGEAQRISAEAPVPIVHLNNYEDRPGGAANVALNLAHLGIKTILIGMIGQDLAGDILIKKIKDANIDTYLSSQNFAPTITKTRIMSHQQQLLRLDTEKHFHTLDHQELIQHYLTLLPNVDAVIISDYHKGTVHDPQIFIQAARKLNIPILVDPKGSSFEIYRDATVLTPNRKEFEIAVCRCNNNEELETHARAAMKKHSLQSLLITRGSEGMSLIQAQQPAIHIPVKGSQVRDVTGAGDTVISILAAAIAAGENWEAAARLANIGAGIVVSKLGTATVSEPELHGAVHQFTARMGILTLDEAIRMREDARLHQEKIVMTNGCFDILHPGHIGYLEAAKALGHRLLVAVNDDASVARNKGPKRPFNSLQDRMIVLSGLRSVDWVVPFSEDTPENLIHKIAPDILVKGVDYSVNDIAGGAFVLSYGGEVKTLGPEKQWSSSEMIGKIKELEHQ